jgi:AraC-like DNA-binding protein
MFLFLYGYQILDIPISRKMKANYKNAEISYQEIKPDSALGSFVKCFWRFENGSANTFSSTILPDGCFDLIIRISDNKLKSISLTGLWSQPINTSADASSVLIGIRFRLLAAEYVFGREIASILNSDLALSPDFWSLNNFPISNFEAFADQISVKLYSIINGGKEMDSRKQKLWDMLYQTNGALTVEEYAKSASWSRRQINRYFNNNFGLSLKAYCNILKTFASFKDIAKGNLYPEDNYFDQSHFIKDIKKYTGTNPKELRKNENGRFLQLSTMPKE